MARSTRPRFPAARSTSSTPTPQPSRTNPAPRWYSTRLSRQAGRRQREHKPALPAAEHLNPTTSGTLTFDSAGRLYIATGNPGAVYRVDPAKPGAAPELFFKSDEAHIRALAWDAKGNLIAGSDGSGLVYRIDPQRQGLRALRSAAARDYFHRDRRQRHHLRGVRGRQEPQPAASAAGAGNGSITITMVQPESLQAANASASVPEGTEILRSQPRARRHASSGRARTTIVYRAGCAARWPARAQRQSRTNLSHSGRRQLRRHRPSAGAARTEPGPRSGCGRHRAEFSSAPATPAKVYELGASENARIRERRSRCGSLCALWPRGD